MRQCVAAEPEIFVIDGHAWRHWERFIDEIQRGLPRGHAEASRVGPALERRAVAVAHPGALIVQQEQLFIRQCTLKRCKQSCGTGQGRAAKQ